MRECVGDQLLDSSDPGPLLRSWISCGVEHRHVARTAVVEREHEKGLVVPEHWAMASNARWIRRAVTLGGNGGADRRVRYRMPESSDRRQYTEGFGGGV